MAYFNEDNVTEQMCIEIAKEAGYEYCGADELREAKNDVIVEPLLQEALIKINHITLAEVQIVIQKVKDVIFQGMSGDIITANQKHARHWCFEFYGTRGHHSSRSLFHT